MTAAGGNGAEPAGAGTPASTDTQLTHPRPAYLIVDCVDLAAVSTFWASLLGMTVRKVEDGWLDLEPLAGGPVLAFQRVPEGKTAKNRLHLDLAVPDVAAAGQRAARLGATAASDLHDGSDPWQVWRDPEGNEFCFVTG
ncbi:MAG: VOC family protein [Actinomycetota bacterium]|nr:VOC family protein [Actinomycetota bacterium]